MRKSSLEIEKMLLALGCSIRSDVNLNLEDFDPEKQILRSLKFYWENNSVFFLVYTSIYERLFPYIHVDRLVKLSKNSIISNDEKCLLAAICSNIGEKDNRFKLAAKKLSKNIKKMVSPPESETDEFLIEEWGVEESLKKFGVKVRAFLKYKKGKLLPLKKTFEVNQWLKYRALLGSNTRSDCAFIIYSSNSNLSASEVARRAYTTRQAVSGYYKDLYLLRDVIDLAG